MEITTEKMLIIIIGLFLILYISSFTNLNELDNDIGQKIPIFIEDLINNQLVRILIFLYIIYRANTDFTSAIIMALVFLFIIHIVNKQKVQNKLEHFDESSDYTTSDIIDILPTIFKSKNIADISLQQTNNTITITIKNIMLNSIKNNPEIIVTVITTIFKSFKLDKGITFKTAAAPVKVDTPVKTAAPVKAAVAPVKVDTPVKAAVAPVKAAVAPVKVDTPVKAASVSAVAPVKAASVSAVAPVTQITFAPTSAPTAAITKAPTPAPTAAITKAPTPAPTEPEITLNENGLMFISSDINKLNIKYLYILLNDNSQHIMYDFNVRNQFVTSSKTRIILYLSKLGKANKNIKSIMILPQYDAAKGEKDGVKVINPNAVNDKDYVIPKNTSVVIKTTTKLQEWKLNEVNPENPPIDFKLFYHEASCNTPSPTDSKAQTNLSLIPTINP